MGGVGDQRSHMLPPCVASVWCAVGTEEELWVARSCCAHATPTGAPLA
jgi:hypothetical protein